LYAASYVDDYDVVDDCGGLLLRGVVVFGSFSAVSRVGRRCSRWLIAAELTAAELIAAEDVMQIGHATNHKTPNQKRL
jgi:hypothetical protein